MQLGELADTAYLSSEGLALGKRFTGAMAGVYVEGDFRGEFCSWTFHVCGYRLWPGKK